MLQKIETTNPFTIALQSEKILDAKKSDMMKMILEVLPKTYYDAGQVMPGHDVNAQKQNLQVLSGALYEEIKTFFPFLKVEELKLSFRNGVRGEYGEFFGLNIVTFHKWIKGFISDERRKQSLLAIKTAKEAEPAPLMTEAEAFEAWKETIQRQFVKFKETGVLISYNPTHHYRRFQELGLIKLDGAQIDEFLTQAKEVCIKEARLRRLNPDSHKHRQELNSFIDRATKGELTATEKEKVRVEARRIAILTYYQTIEKLEI